MLISDSSTDSGKPHPGLAANFEVRALNSLQLSTELQIWGDSSHSPLAMPSKPNGKEDQAMLSAGAWRCEYCGFASRTNSVDHISGNHRDVRKENLSIADPLCHGWHHLGEFDEQQAVLAYLPGISPQDVNHLQRTAIMAVNADDQETREAGEKVLRWMASHREYSRAVWGSHSTSAFAPALERASEEGLVGDFVLEGLAVVFNPRHFAHLAKGWVAEASKLCNLSSWAKVSHSVMNVPI